MLVILKFPKYTKPTEGKDLPDHAQTAALLWTAWNRNPFADQGDIAKARQMLSLSEKIDVLIELETEKREECQVCGQQQGDLEFRTLRLRGGEVRVSEETWATGKRVAKDYFKKMVCTGKLLAQRIAAEDYLDTVEKIPEEDLLPTGKKTNKRTTKTARSRRR